MLVDDIAGGSVMESNERFYARRASEELRAAERAVTPEAKARRRALAEAFQMKMQAERSPAPRAREMGGLAVEAFPSAQLTGA